MGRRRLVLDSLPTPSPHLYIPGRTSLDHLEINLHTVYWYHGFNTLFQTYTFTTNVLDALFTTFRGQSYLCILVHSTSLMVYNIITGEQYKVSLPFSTSTLLRMDFGLVIVRTVHDTISQKTTSRSTSPLLFSLSHPLEECKPIEMMHGNEDESLKVIGSIPELSLLITYTTTMCVYTVWKLNQEEIQARGVSNSTSQLISETSWFFDSKSVVFDNTSKGCKPNESMIERSVNITQDTMGGEEGSTPIVAEYNMTRQWCSDTINVPTKESSSTSSVFMAMTPKLEPVLCIYDNVSQHLLLQQVIFEPTAQAIGPPHAIPCNGAIPIPHWTSTKWYHNDILLLQQHDSSAPFALYCGHLLLCEWDMPDTVGSEAPVAFSVPACSPVLSSMQITTPCKSTNQVFASPHGLSPIPTFSTPVRNTKTTTSNLHFRSAGGSLFTYEYQSQRHLLTLSLSPHSELVSECLQAIESILPLAVSSKLRVEFFGILNSADDCTLDIHGDQEWILWVNVLRKFIHGNTTHDEKNSIANQPSAWDKLLSSSYHTSFLQQQPRLRDCLYKSKTPIITKTINNNTQSDVLQLSVQQCASLFESLHLLYEECKLNVHKFTHVQSLASLLSYLAERIVCNADEYLEFYRRDFGPELSPKETTMKDTSSLNQSVFNNIVPSIMDWLKSVMQQVTTGIAPRHFPELSSTACDSVGLTLCTVQELYILLFSDDVTTTHDERCASVVNEMAARSFTLEDLDLVPFGIALPLRQALWTCRQHPSHKLSHVAYKLIGRADLAKWHSVEVTPGASVHLDASAVNDPQFADLIGKGTPSSEREDVDGLKWVQILSAKRFGRDRRLKEVARLLRSSTPQPLRFDSNTEMTEIQTKLAEIAKRTMALSVGRGMFTLGTINAHLTEVMEVPKVCLSGRTTGPAKTTVALDMTSIPEEVSHWPDFHNGVATGLRLVPGLKTLTRAWIVYNKPEEPSFAHAGILLALGLRGYLSVLAMTDLFDYLSESHPATTSGLLLGMAATKRGTMDRNVSKMLCLHLPSLLPPPFAEIEVDPLAQTSALMGIGLLYQGTGNRLMTEFLLAEIGRAPTSDKFDCRESYNLTAGLALGMVILASGTKKTDAGLCDLNIDDRLRSYMVGGKRKESSTPGQRQSSGDESNNHPESSNNSSKCSRLWEGPQVNIEVTSAGATLALGMMFIKSGNPVIASRLSVPDTLHCLDYVRPDLLILRVLARNLVLWDDILPSQAWSEEQLPSILRSCFDPSSKAAQEVKPIDRETVTQAYANIIAGAALSIGLRYSSTASEEAQTTLIYWITTFTEFRTLRKKLLVHNERGWLIPSKILCEKVLGILAISLGLVMAGHGDLTTLKVLRSLRIKFDVDVSYGTHMALNMGIGLLFLGGGNMVIIQSDEAIASLIVSLYPHFAHNTVDNMYHCQAFRHFYVLATSPRLLQAIDVETSVAVYVPIKIWTNAKNGVTCTTPCLLPEMGTVTKIQIDSPRYYDWVIDRNQEEGRKLFTVVESSGIVYVQRKKGHLSYEQDALGHRSLLSQAFPKEPVWSTRLPAWSARHNMSHFVSAFTEDPQILAYCDYFSNTHDGRDTDTQATQFATFCTSVLYECLTKEKPEIVSTYMSLFHGLREIQNVGNTLLFNQLCFVLEYHRCSSYQAESMINKDFIHSIHGRLEEIIGSSSGWCKDTVNTSHWPEKYSVLHSAYLMYKGIPFPSVLTSESNKQGTVQLGDILRLSTELPSVPIEAVLYMTQ